jgi:hypothetical protein
MVWEYIFSLITPWRVNKLLFFFFFIQNELDKNINKIQKLEHFYSSHILIDY